MKTTRTLIGTVLIAIVAATSLAQEKSSKQVAPGAHSERRKSRVPHNPPRPHDPPQVEVEADSEEQVEGSRVEVGQATLKLERGGKVSVSNSAGPIAIVGSDRDTVEARAISGSGPVGIRIYQSPTRPILVLSVSSVEGRRFNGEARLEITVPRYADIDVADNAQQDLRISDVDGNVSAGAKTGSITVNRVGSLQLNTTHGEATITQVKGGLTARSSYGEISVDTVGGRVDVTSTYGEVTINNAAADVRVSSSFGPIAIACTKGRVEATTTDGSVALVGIAGDVEANTVNGQITFTGPIRAGGRYRFKSLSGAVEMAVQSDPPGFTATLVTYNGEIETAFPLKVNTPLRSGSHNRRITGVYGDGQAQLVLDSFNGAVRIVRSKTGQGSQCN
jgi:DUF4097 and DUF4098 domain-containing protein YvlB